MRLYKYRRRALESGLVMFPLYVSERSADNDPCYGVEPLEEFLAGPLRTAWAARKAAPFGFS
ncbi:hypothetical protein TOC8171_17050 [Pseudomonas syringae]